MHWFRSVRSRATRMTTARNSWLRATTIACLAVASVGFAVGPVRAQNAGDKSADGSEAALRNIIKDVARGRRVSASVDLPLQIGFFNGDVALYITPEVGVDPTISPSVVPTAEGIATGFNSNFIPTNFETLPQDANQAQSPAIDDIFVFTNFTQGNVLASAPNPAGPGNTDTTYSPIWQISLVTWVSGTPRTLKSQADVLTAQTNSEVTVTRVPIIVECSVVFTPGGGLLPGAAIKANRGN